MDTNHQTSIHFKKCIDFCTRNCITPDIKDDILKGLGKSKIRVVREYNDALETLDSMSIEMNQSTNNVDELVSKTDAYLMAIITCVERESKLQVIQEMIREISAIPLPKKPVKTVGVFRFQITRADLCKWTSIGTEYIDKCNIAETYDFNVFINSEGEIYDMVTGTPALNIFRHIIGIEMFNFSKPRLQNICYEKMGIELIRT